MLEERSSKVTGLQRRFFWMYILATITCILAASVISLAIVSANKPNTNKSESPQSGVEDQAGDTQNNNTQNSGNQGGQNNNNQNNQNGGNQGGQNNNDTIVIPSSVPRIPAPGIHTGNLVLVNNDHTYLSKNAGFMTGSTTAVNGSLQIVNVRDNRTSNTYNLQVSGISVELSYALVDALCKMADAMVEATGTERNLVVPGSMPNIVLDFSTRFARSK